jgi:multisubunit Na+/H+ antiporter MnhC subunit
MILTTIIQFALVSIYLMIAINCNEKDLSDDQKNLHSAIGMNTFRDVYDICNLNK